VLSQNVHCGAEPGRPTGEAREPQRQQLAFEKLYVNASTACSSWVGRCVGRHCRVLCCSRGNKPS